MLAFKARAYQPNLPVELIIRDLSGFLAKSFKDRYLRPLTSLFAKYSWEGYNWAKGIWRKRHLSNIYLK